MTEITMTGQIDLSAAKRLDNRIRLMAATVRENLTKIAALVEEAKSGQIHVALGFASWTAYLADALGGQLELTTESRRAVVELMAGEGMSQRAIAQAVGVSQKTVDRDLDKATQVSHGDSPAERCTGCNVNPARRGDCLCYACFNLEAQINGTPLRPPSESPEPPPVVIGLDGKTYTKPQRPPKKKPVKKPTPASIEEAMRIAARAAELSAWGKACDGLLAALSYAASSTPPDDTDRYPAVDTFCERYAALGGHIQGWTPGVIESTAVDALEGYDHGMDMLLSDPDDAVELLANDADGALAACLDHLTIAAALLRHANKIGNLETLHPAYAPAAADDLHSAETWVMRLANPERVLRDEEGSVVSALEALNDVLRDGGRPATEVTDR